MHFVGPTGFPAGAPLRFANRRDGPEADAGGRIDGRAREEGLSPAGAGPLRRAASTAAIARSSARP